MGLATQLAGYKRRRDYIITLYVGRPCLILSNSFLQSTLSLIDAQRATTYDGFDGTKNDTGLVRVYTRSNNKWVQRGSDIEGEPMGEECEIAIALSSGGSILANGAWINNEVNSEAGSVRVFVWTGTDWVQQGVDVNGEGTEEHLGASVALSNNGTILAIGSAGHHGLIGNMSGRVRVYEWDCLDCWVQRGEGIEGDSFGKSVSVSDDGRILAKNTT